MWEALVQIVKRRGCNHDWEIIHQREYDAVPPEKWDSGHRAHTRMLLKCKKCGKLQTIIL